MKAFPSRVRDVDSVDKPHSGVDSSQERHGQLMDKAWITPEELFTPCPQPAHTSPATCLHLHNTGLTHPAHIPGGDDGSASFFHYFMIGARFSNLCG